MLADLLRDVNGIDKKSFVIESCSLTMDSRLYMHFMDSGEERARCSDDEMAEMVHISHPNAQNRMRTEGHLTAVGKNWMLNSKRW